MSPILSAGETVATLVGLLITIALWTLLEPNPSTYRRQRRPSSADGDAPDQRPGGRGRKKPQWVPDEVIHLAALNPEGSCRTIADTFHAMYLGVESVFSERLRWHLFRQAPIQSSTTSRLRKVRTG